MAKTSDTCLHATAVKVGGTGVLMTGVSGTGKSDLALRLIDRGAVLVCDDQCLLTVADGGLMVSAPQAIKGLIEVRGVGVLDVDHSGPVRVGLHIFLTDDASPDRLPDLATYEVAGVKIPSLTLNAFAASAPIKVELAVKCLAMEGSAVATFLT